MHHGFVYLGMMFGDIVNQVIEFLREHPLEFVIMFMQNEYVSEATTMTECEILKNKYIKPLGNLFVQFRSVTDTIGKHRGKIWLARGNNGFEKCVASLACEQQNQWKISPTFTRVDKWKTITSFQDKMFNRDDKRKAIVSFQDKTFITYFTKSCYINYLSAHGGKIGPNTISNKYLKEPAYFLQEEDPPGMNYKMTKYFRNPKNTLYIVMADHPLPQLLDKIVISNYE
ncbi:1-phosphatidylinositol phosphodiesterase-like [Microplitis mediator]|uniref:1-phosphatidylinositol phosphodiesterase-like n=1 Tax=Microplitis mediator TaxID=375433 RepID=UPI002554329B|nr:1-phosphatidylinositol phosphodiesterase-like [Microplitis mediator]